MLVGYSIDNASVVAPWVGRIKNDEIKNALVKVLKVVYVFKKGKTELIC